LSDSPGVTLAHPHPERKKRKKRQRGGRDESTASPTEVTFMSGRVRGWREADGDAEKKGNEVRERERAEGGQRVHLFPPSPPIASRALNSLGGAVCPSARARCLADGRTGGMNE